MICHPVEIGDAACLPWHVGKPELAAATVTTLDGSSSALVHMETLRRAAHRCEGDTDLATQLLGVLTARALDAEIAGGAGAALPLLDAGYLAQCYDQLGLRTGVRCGPAGGITGYAWVRRSLDLSPDDAEIEFAAAMMTAMAAGPEHDRHVARARELASPGSLVARNLEVHAKNIRPHFRHGADASARSGRAPG